MMEPVVKTADGVLRGRILASVRGGSYFSFQGIPYAQPPVGPLRFKPPVQVEPWTGEREVLLEGKACPSLSLVTMKVEENTSEDCLFLNVYTKELPGNNSVMKPVLFYIHGGGFFNGSGDSNILGPDFLVQKDIVLITINYRLNVFGFLSLQNELCPGNNGLKDQVEALRWVQRNVSAFGGDPDNVTIFGESAGGAAVQYLMLSPLSRGLFHRAISQSGSVLNPWAFTYHPRDFAFKLGEVLGCKTESDEELLNFLRNVPFETFTEPTYYLMKHVEPERYYKSGAFVPVIEPPSSSAFLTEDPEKLVKEGRLHDVPYMLGVNDIEGPILELLGFTPDCKTVEYSRLLPVHRQLTPSSTLAVSIIEKIKAFYFPDGYNKQKYSDALSSIYFWFGNEEVLKGLSKNTKRKSQAFFYFFTFDKEPSVLKDLSQYSDLPGSFHTDDILCLFYANETKRTVIPGSAYEKVIDTFCNLWTDFAATGDPTPKTKLWSPYTSKEKVYLEINDHLRIGTGLKNDEMNFWSNIFDEINNATIYVR